VRLSHHGGFVVQTLSGSLVSNRLHLQRWVCLEALEKDGKYPDLSAPAEAPPSAKGRHTAKIKAISVPLVGPVEPVVVQTGDSIASNKREIAAANEGPRRSGRKTTFVRFVFVSPLATLLVCFEVFINLNY
jgi:hypothetical protein